MKQANGVLLFGLTGVGKSHFACALGHALVETDKTSARPSDADLLRGPLTRMGFRAAEADYAVSALGARVDADTVPLADLVREVLGVLAQRLAPGGKAKRR